jgi:hypothetical protein
MCDPKVESLLARLGVPWEYISVNINLIDAAASRSNQARLSAELDEGHVEEYAEAMKRGDTFPALVGHALGDGTFFLNGGNHRLAAARRSGRTAIDLYLIRTNDAGMRHLVTVLLNTLEGVRPSRADLMAQCVYAIEQYHYDLAAAAQHFGLPLGAVQTERRRIITRGRLEAAGIDPAALPVRTVDALYQVSNDVAFKEAASLVSAARLPDAEVRQFMTEVREQRTEAGAQAVVQQWRERDSVKLRRGGLIKRRASGPAAVRGRLLAALGGAQTILAKNTTRALLGLTSDEDMVRAVDLAASVWERLESVRGSQV